MRIETVPLIVGAVVTLLGLLLLYDAWTPDEPVWGGERRRRPRRERSRGGETAIGLGVLCLAAAMFGRDSWPYSILAAMGGTALVLLGAVLNRHYIHDLLAYHPEAPDRLQEPNGPATESRSRGAMTVPDRSGNPGPDTPVSASGRSTPRPSHRLRIR